jgi:uncharacterized protein YjbI with pentapeptide repeats
MTRPAKAPVKYQASIEVDLHGAFIRRTVLSGASLVGANLTRADCRFADFSFTRLTRACLRLADFTGANLRGADFADADLEGTILIGADLTSARNLTAAQLQSAIVDKTTKLPAELSVAAA